MLRFAIPRHALAALLFAGAASVAPAQQTRPPAEPPAGDAQTATPHGGGVHARGDAAGPDAKTRRAMLAYAQGMALIRAGKTEQAVTALKNAVVLQPDSAAYRYGLATAYDVLGLMPNKWFQLRQAVRLKPDHGDAVGAFLDMWRTALAQGVLDVGNTPDEVQDGLGKPDLAERRDGDGDELWQYGFMAVNFKQGALSSVMDLRGIDRYRPAAARLELGDLALTPARHQISIASHKREFRVDDAAGLITVERLPGAATDGTLAALLGTIEAGLRRQFETLEWQVLDRADDSVLVEWRADDGPHELLRLFRAGPDIHRYAYTAPAIADRERWLQRLRAATLTPAG